MKSETHVVFWWGVMDLDSFDGSIKFYKFNFILYAFSIIKIL